MTPEPVTGWTLLAPELQPLVDALPSQPPTDRDTLFSTWRVELPALGTTDAVERADVTVTHDDVPVPARLHRPLGIDGPLPCIINIHGGGYIAGSQALDDYLFEQWAPTLGVLGVSLDYRLAPEAPYPAALDDCVALTRWVQAHANDLGVDSSRIGLMGPSAGGGLATALALRLRDEGDCPFAFMLLDAPMLDDRQATPSSQLDRLAVWSRESNTFGWKSYLGELYGQQDIPPYAAPARAADVRGLPPVFLTTGTADGFRDENLAFAGLLAEQGVAVDLTMYAGAPHGYGMFGQWPNTLRASRDRLEWTARQLGITLSLTDAELASNGVMAFLERAFSNLVPTGTEV